MPPLRRAALRALVIGYGGIAGLNDKYGDIDQATEDLAAKNEFSSLKNLQRNYEQGIEAYKRGLSARGALQSSDLQTGLDLQDRQKGQLQYDLSTQFSNAAQSAINDYISTEAQIKQQEAQAIWDALNAASAWWDVPVEDVPIEYGAQPEPLPTAEGLLVGRRAAIGLAGTSGRPAALRPTGIARPTAVARPTPAPKPPSIARAAGWS